jgi:hypothetical protein
VMNCDVRRWEVISGHVERWTAMGGDACPCGPMSGHALIPPVRASIEASNS